MSNSKNEKSQLIEHLYAVLNTEIDKPYDEIDAELIDACVELILELQGKNFTLSNEDIEEAVRKIPFVEVADFEAARKKRKKTNKKKILLIAAIIAILCAILAVMSSGDEWSIVDYIFNEYDDVDDVPTNEPITAYDEEIVFLGDASHYTDPKEFCEKEGIHNILFPTDLPEAVQLNYMYKVKEEGKDVVIVYFSGIEGYGVTLDSEIPQWVKDNADKTYTTESGILCYIKYVKHTENAHLVQIYFEHNGNYYSLTGIDKEQTLLDIIESLEEIE